MIKTAISVDLYKKIERDIVVRPLISYKCKFDTSAYKGTLNFDISERHLYEECLKWKKDIIVYFSTSYRGGCIKRIGQYGKIRPVEVFCGRVIFSIAYCFEPNWKDWFIIDDNIKKRTIYPWCEKKSGV